MPDTHTPLVSIHKLDDKGLELWVYEGVILDHSETQITVEARFDRADIEIEGLQLNRGDRFVETYFFNRWYNIFAIYQVETSKFKGWYCNITRPAWLDGNHLYAEDLALDLIVLPDRRMTVVDQAEFDNLTLPVKDRHNAYEALNELIDFATNGIGLFALGV
jgi:protein associated with RNAse G/E